MPQTTDTPTKSAAELNKLLEEMESVAQTFLNEAEKFVKSWYWNCAEFYVMKYYDNTRELGAARLAELKSEITRIDNNTQAFVTRLIGAAKFWTHRAQSGQWSNVDFAKGAPIELVAAISTVTNEIKPSLRRHGYLPASGKFDSDIPDPKEWPDLLNTLIEKYRTLVRKGLFLKSELRAAEEDQKRHEAQDLWENA